MRMARIVYSVARWWRCYFLLLIASILSFFLIYVSKNDPNLEYYFPYFRLGSNYYNFYASGGAEKIKKLMETNNLDYEFLVSNSKVCIQISNDYDLQQDKTLDFLFVSISQVANVKHRIAARSTWLKYLDKFNSKLLFFVGNENYNKIDAHANVDLNNEMKTHGDMIQINMPDHENYTSTKTLISLRWALTYCSKVKYIFVISESAILNLKKFQQLFYNSSNLIKDMSINGQCDYTDENFAMALKLFFKELNIKTGSNDTKNKVSLDDYQGQYCSNLGWIITVNGARRLWETALRSPYMMRISPGYLNGYLAYKARLNSTNQFKFQDSVPKDKNCLKEFETRPNLLLCAENFTISSRYSNYISHWNSPAQGQLNFIKL